MISRSRTSQTQAPYVLQHPISSEGNWQAKSWNKDHLHSAKQVLRHKSLWSSIRTPRDPATARVKNKLRSSSTKKVTNTVKTVTLRQSFEIQRMLNFTELWPALVHPDLKFLKVSELERINRLPNDTQKSNELLLLLAKRSSHAACKFLVCLWLTREHLGHEELFSLIFPKVPEGRIQTIVQLCKSLSPSQPEKPPAFIELEGDLTDAKFLKFQSRLWDLFGRGSTTESLS